MDLTAAGGALGIPGLYVTGDPGAADKAAQQGSLSIRLGLGWAKSHSFVTGQCPVMRYHRALMNAVLHDKVHIGDAVNATVIGLEDAPHGYAEFDSGVARKYVLDPHNTTGRVKAAGLPGAEPMSGPASAPPWIASESQRRLRPADLPARRPASNRLSGSCSITTTGLPAATSAPATRYRRRRGPPPPH